MFGHFSPSSLRFVISIENCLFPGFFFKLKNSLFLVLPSIADRKMSVTCPSNARKFASRSIFLTHECDATHFAIRALCLSFRGENDKAFRWRKVRRLIERREIETMSTRAERKFENIDWWMEIGDDIFRQLSIDDFRFDPISLVEFL